MKHSGKIYIGLKWAYLEVISERYRRPNNQYYCDVRCVCGTEKPLRTSEVRAQTTKSCGCKMLAGKLAAATKHGHSRRNSKSSEYSCYHAMINRCYNKNDVAFDYYGGKGIVVCDRWRSDFKLFLEDMGPRPKGFSIERKDKNLGYVPSNCLWASSDTQSRNKSNNRFVVFNGETMCMRDACIKAGISEGKVYCRVRKHDVEHQEAFDFICRAATARVA